MQGNANTAAKASTQELTISTQNGSVEIIQNVSLDIAAGEILGLVGESGSGKSTLGLAFLWHANRGLTLRSGSVTVDNIDLKRLSSGELRHLRGRRITYVPQDPVRALNPALRLGAQIREILSLSTEFADESVREARLIEVVGEVGLPTDAQFLARYPHQLSGGQQQRITIAMAFACRPSMVVLDEPTTGLDVNIQKRVLEMIRQLCTQYGTAAVYVSHDLAVVAEISNRIAVFYSGRVVELGETKSVLSRPAHPYTKRLLAALPDPRSSQILVGIPGRAPLPESRPSGCTFHPRCDYARADCALAEPPQRDVSAGHSSRCWFAEEVHQDDTRVATQIPAAPRVVAQAGLVVSNLLARYGNKPVVHDASFSVSPGECLAVVGESGSGKTTVSRCIVGMHAAYDGTITLAGAVLPKSARNRSKEARRAIQYIFQNPHSALNPRRNIEEILLQWSDVLVGGPMAEQRRLVAGTLEQVGLGSEYLGRYPDELSGGQQQRVAIARALICDPAYLICDEVTSALDVSVQASVVTLLGELARTKGLGMLFITHNLPLVRSIAQQVVVMQSGRVVEVGSTEQIFSLPQEAYTRDLLVNTPSLSSAIAGNLARDDGTLARNGLLV